nr:hypothetical protein Itr_chr01CG11300 [Ipomoea trifida]
MEYVNDPEVEDQDLRSHLNARAGSDRTHPVEPPPQEPVNIIHEVPTYPPSMGQMPYQYPHELYGDPRLELPMVATHVSVLLPAATLSISTRNLPAVDLLPGPGSVSRASETACYSLQPGAPPSSVRTEGIHAVPRTPSAASPTTGGPDGIRRRVGV